MYRLDRLDRRVADLENDVKSAVKWMVGTMVAVIGTLSVFVYEGLKR